MRQLGQLTLELAVLVALLVFVILIYVKIA
jgi:hypothetical protein